MNEIESIRYCADYIVGVQDALGSFYAELFAGKLTLGLLVILVIMLWRMKK